MVDIFALSVSHGLLAIALWRLLARDDLFDENPEGKGKKRRPPVHHRMRKPDA